MRHRAGIAAAEERHIPSLIAGLRDLHVTQAMQIIAGHQSGSSRGVFVLPSLRFRRIPNSASL